MSFDNEGYQIVTRSRKRKMRQELVTTEDSLTQPQKEIAISSQSDDETAEIQNAPVFTDDYPQLSFEEELDRDDMIGIIYNDCYGGLQFPKEFIDDYSKLTGQQKTELDSWLPRRSGPILTKLFQAWEANNKLCLFPRVCKPVLALIPIWCCYEIDEYDGFERLTIDVDSTISKAVKIYLTTGRPEVLIKVVHKLKNLDRKKINVAFRNGYYLDKLEIHKTLSDLII